MAITYRAVLDEPSRSFSWLYSSFLILAVPAYGYVEGVFDTRILVSTSIALASVTSLNSMFIGSTPAHITDQMKPIQMNLQPPS
jgi:hypothetical protein